MTVKDKNTEKAVSELNKLFVCVYDNSKSGPKVQIIHNAKRAIAGYYEYVQGWSEKHGTPVTLRTDRIKGVFDTVEEAEQSLASSIPLLPPKEFKYLPEGEYFRKDSGSALEVCFSGFNADNRKLLESRAREVGMLVRTRVTTNLHVLVAGKRVGPAKQMQAVALGAFILNEDQFLLLAQNGELPDELPEHFNEVAKASKKEARSRVELDRLEKLQEELATSFAGVKTLPRRENPIAIFENDRAVGWKFHVPKVFREALDIKLTPFTVYGQTRETWTQGHAYSFKVGDSIGSHNTNDWKEFLNQENATLLQVKFATPAGFDENKKFEGPISGGFFASKTAKQPTEVEGLNLTTSSYTYDPGVLTVSVFKPNSERNKVELFDTLVLDQVEFVTLLQFGYYWQKPESKEDETTLKKIQLIP
ncbi:hypothetical protein L1D61_26375 [Vibrio mediterranei]|nr:hypothetical protein [Vibrio mediterranei]